MPLPLKKKVQRLQPKNDGRHSEVVSDEVITEDEEPDETFGSKSDRPVLDAAKYERDIQKLLKFTTFEPEQRYWLDTGSPEMNAVLGSKDYGIPYGKMTEVRGKNHGGKTTLTLLLAGLAQADGAGVGYIDPEESRDELWTDKLGGKYAEMIKVYPKLIQDKKSAPPRLQCAEELFAEAEAGMQLMHSRGIKKQFWFLDSVANLNPGLVIEKGVQGQNGRTKLERAQFLGQALPVWAGLAANYNAAIYLINQIRVNPMQMFGDPEYSPGGNAFQHTCSVRVSVRRVKNGRLKKGDKVVGLVGLVTNFKNKAGRGSVQDEKCAFVIRWKGTGPARHEFISLEDAEELMGA